MLKLMALMIWAAAYVPGPPDPRWRAILEPVGGTKVSGGVTVEAKGADSSKFTVAIRGAPANSTLIWHMHSGKCTGPGAPVGAPTSYPVLRAGPGGTAEAAVTLPVAPPGSGDFVILIHLPTGTPAACGELKALGEAAPRP